LPCALRTIACTIPVQELTRLTNVTGFSITVLPEERRGVAQYLLLGLHNLTRIARAEPSEAHFTVTIGALRPYTQYTLQVIFHPVMTALHVKPAAHRGNKGGLRLCHKEGWYCYCSSTASLPACARLKACLNRPMSNLPGRRQRALHSQLSSRAERGTG